MKWGFLFSLLLFAGCAAFPKTETSTRPHFVGLWVMSQGTQCPILDITQANDTHITVNGEVLPIVPGHNIVTGPEEIATRDAQFTVDGSLLSYTRLHPRISLFCSYSHGDIYASTRPAFVGHWRNSGNIGCSAFPARVAIGYVDQSRVTVDGKTWQLRDNSADGRIFTGRFGFRLTQGGITYLRPGPSGWDTCLFVRPDRTLPTVTGQNGEKIYLIKPPLPEGLTSALRMPGPRPDLSALFSKAPPYCAIVDVDRNGKIMAATTLLSTGNADADESLQRWFLAHAFKPALLDGAPVAAREIVGLSLNPAALNQCDWDNFDQAATMPLDRQ